MTVSMLITAGVLACALGALALDLWSPEAVLLAGLALVTAAGVIDLETALLGFGNPALMALATLYVVAAALEQSGALDRATAVVLGKGDQSVRQLLSRMCPAVTGYSAFLNNTPVVAMGIPALRRWGRSHQVPASKLLIPLSFAAIVGGICTLIGTSTNLVVHGLLQAQGYPGFGFFELGWLGLPCAALGLGYIIVVSPALTPVRSDIREEEENERARLLELELTGESPLCGLAVREAGIESLGGLALERINRDHAAIGPVPPETTLRAGDRLLYRSAGHEDSGLPDLTNYPGLRLSARAPRNTAWQEGDRELHEVVIKEGSRLVGSTLEEERFFERFGAAVTGIWRGGRRMDRTLREVQLRPGDVLMLDTGPGFREAFGRSNDFFVTTEIGGEVSEEDLEEPVRVRAGGTDLYVSVAVLIGIVGSVASGLLHVALAGMLGVIALLTAGVIEPGEAREAVDWSVLLVIGAALGLGQAMEASGTAALLGTWIVDLTAPYGARAVLAGVVIATALLTEMITNIGAVALMFPVVTAVAQSQGFEPRALFVAMTLAGSLSFMTPIGYQTNLMVYGPGNYRFTDFFRVGAPLGVLLWVVLIAGAPIVWPL